MSLLISNSATRSTKVLKNISSFNLIIADLEKNNHLIFDLEQRVLEFSRTPSTRIRIFLKTHLFYPFWVSVHTETAFSVTKNESFRKRYPEWIFFENAVFMLSCGRVKTELFENADVKASIYDVSEHAHGSLGKPKGHFDCLFSFVEVRTAKFECSSVFVWTGIFSKTLLVWTRISLKTDKKRCVFKNIRIRVDGA